MRRVQVGKDEKKQMVIEKSGEYVVELVGEGAHVDVLGVLVARGSQEIAVDVAVHHKVQNTSADTFIRAVAYDSSKVKLSGLIKIDKGAQKTNAFLKENVLLMSKKAQADAIPNLEIEADDVKASHAATVGKIDEEQLFYLMSRGLSKKKAESMIVSGFLGAVRLRIKNYKS